MTVSSHNTIILFTRYPRPGECKTRLLSQYSAEEAADIHRQLVARSTQTITAYLQHHKETTYHIYYTGASIKEMKEWLGEQYLFFPQKGENLGQRMAESLTETLKQNHKCLLMGSDCPALTPHILEQGFGALDRSDIILGPAHDGGYYLVGTHNRITSQQIASLFADIPWGTSDVLTTTLQRIQEMQLDGHLLPKLHDIDTPDDLHYFHHYTHTE